MAALSLSPQVFVILAGLIESHAGLHYRPEDRELLEEKLSGPAQEAGFESLLDYYYFLRYDPAGPRALDRLIETLVVHETFFFREELALKVLVERKLSAAATALRPMRVWSAACATGEEPLTLAMMLGERDLLSKVEIVASDVSQAALDRAKRGEYSGRSLRALPHERVGRWMNVSGERASIRPQLREAISWQRLNLLDEKAVSGMGTFDAILCRNVLIYFKDETAMQVVRSLMNALRPGGVLVVGTSESLLRYGTDLRCEEWNGSFFYARES